MQIVFIYTLEHVAIKSHPNRWSTAILFHFLRAKKTLSVVGKPPTNLRVLFLLITKRSKEHSNCLDGCYFLSDQDESAQFITINEHFRRRPSVNKTSICAVLLDE